jgi:hypothetical protein
VTTRDTAPIRPSHLGFAEAPSVHSDTRSGALRTLAGTLRWADGSYPQNQRNLVGSVILSLQRTIVRAHCSGGAVYVP